MPEPQSVTSAFDGVFFRVDIEDWEGIGPWDVVHHPGAAAVLPIQLFAEASHVGEARKGVRGRRVLEPGLELP